MHSVFTKIFAIHKIASLEFGYFSGWPVLYTKIISLKALTENVVLSQRVEKDVKSSHLEPAFFFLLLLDYVLDYCALCNRVLARRATHFWSRRSAL